jgi:hypothetical protein
MWSLIVLSRAEEKHLGTSWLLAKKTLYKAFLLETQRSKK